MTVCIIRFWLKLLEFHRNPRGFSKHVTGSMVTLALKVFHAQLIPSQNILDYCDNCRAFDVWYFVKTKKCVVCFQGLHPLKAKGKLFVVGAVGYSSHIVE